MSRVRRAGVGDLIEFRSHDIACWFESYLFSVSVPLDELLMVIEPPCDGLITLLTASGTIVRLGSGSVDFARRI